MRLRAGFYGIVAWAAVLTAALVGSDAYAVSDTVVISEFRTRGPQGGNDEFIEIYNLSPAPVAIGGWKINGSSSTGAVSTRATVAAGTVLNPGCRFLAVNSSANGYSGTVPGDQTYGSGIADNGGVALLNASNAVVDAVGMSAGSAYGEGSNLNQTTTNANQSQERKPLGQNSQDSDNNAQDFLLNSGTSGPQNLAAGCTPVTAQPAGATVSPSAGSTAVAEGGATDTYTIVLDTIPTADVTVTMTPDAQVTTTPAVLRFTPANWNSPQTVTVTAVDDALAEGAHTGTISHLITSTDPAYRDIVVGELLATITDNDTVAAACGASATRISAIQGTGASSPLSGQGGVTVEGIVVGDYQGTAADSLRGFFVQEEDGDSDGNPATSEGLFVFDNGNPAYSAIKVGDRVRITGTVSEFAGMTQLATLTNVDICSSGVSLPTPVVLSLPVPGVPAGDLAAATAAINAFYEAYEGMLVQFANALAVSEYFQLERFGQLILTQGGRIPTFTNTTPPSVTGWIDHQIDVAKRKVILDDRNNVQNSALTNTTPLFYPQPGLSVSNRFRGGDTIANLTGILHWSSAGAAGTDAWRIRPVPEQFSYAFNAVNARPVSAPNVGGTLKIASFNVLNYFTTIDTTASTSSGPCGPNGLQDCRGADSAAELLRQTDKAVRALCGLQADIIGLMEIENNETESLRALVDAANGLAGCGPYAYVDSGSLGGDAIKVGLLYKSTTVAPLGSYAVLTNLQDPRFLDSKNRPALAQTFQEIATSEKLTVAVNHLKSKGSDCNDVSDPDLSDGQGNCSVTRTRAASALVDWLATDPTNSDDADFLIIGDLNSYAKENPITAILAGADDVVGTVDDYTNLVNTFGGASAYSYVFEGQTGYLDHALASRSLLGQVTGTSEWHINADEPPSFDYNDTVADSGEASFEAKPRALPLYEVNEFRTSDHDTVLIGVDLTLPVNSVIGNAGSNRLIGTDGNDRLIGLEGRDTLIGGAGYDQFVYNSALDGSDIVADFTSNIDKVVLTNLLQSLRITSADPIAQGYLQCTGSGADSVLAIDRDAEGPAQKRSLALFKNTGCAALMRPANFRY